MWDFQCVEKPDFEAHHGPGNSFPTCLRPGFGEVALKYGRREHYYNACTPHHRGGWINKGHVMAVDKSCCASGQVKCTGTSGKSLGAMVPTRTLGMRAHHMLACGTFSASKNQNQTLKRTMGPATPFQRA